MSTLRIALSKGRIFEETLPLLQSAGIEPSEDPSESRKLIIPSIKDDVEFLIVRASDVPTYVQLAGADIGIVGKDVLMEHGGDGVLEVLDMQIAQCRLMVAGFQNRSKTGGSRLRVATKYPQCARHHFASKAEQVEIIKLYGSMELAPLVGLADLIVDVVDTGATLRANGLEPLEELAQISSRLIVNRASMKIHHNRILPIIDKIREAIVSPGSSST